MHSPLERRRGAEREAAEVRAADGRERESPAQELCGAVRQSAYDMGLLACDPRSLHRWLLTAWNASLTCTTLRDTAERTVHHPPSPLRNTTAGILVSHRQFSQYALTGCSSPTADDCIVAQLFRDAPPADEVDGPHAEASAPFTASHAPHSAASSPSPALRLGSLDLDRIFVGMFVNRTDQGWSRPEMPSRCI